MPRSATAIQAEITSLETYLQSASSFISSTGSDGTSVSQAERAKLEQRLDSLYAQLGRADGSNPMLVRGRLKNMR